jgi:hypothetical protein
VTSFKPKVHFSRQEAAELLTDLAYALVVGGPLTFRLASEQIEIPIADELLVACRTRSNGGRTELVLRLSGSIAASPTTSAA